MVTECPTLDLEMRLVFKRWIIVVEQLTHFSLVIDLKYRRLFDSTTSITSNDDLLATQVHSISTIHHLNDQKQNNTQSIPNTHAVRRWNKSACTTRYIFIVRSGASLSPNIDNAIRHLEKRDSYINYIFFSLLALQQTPLILQLMHRWNSVKKTPGDQFDFSYAN